MSKNLKKVVTKKVLKVQKPKKYAKIGFLFRFELVKKTQQKKNRQTFLFNYTAPRAIALGTPHIFG